MGSGLDILFDGGRGGTGVGGAGSFSAGKPARELTSAELVIGVRAGDGRNTTFSDESLSWDGGRPNGGTGIDFDGPGRVLPVSSPAAAAAAAAAGSCVDFSPWPPSKLS